MYSQFVLVASALINTIIGIINLIYSIYIPYILYYNTGVTSVCVS